MDGEQQSAAQAADLLMEHGVEARDRITFRADTAQAAADAVGQLAKHSTACPAGATFKRSATAVLLVSDYGSRASSEMIQNADDAGATEVRVAFADGSWSRMTASLSNSEYVFGIAMPWITTKDQDPDATGGTALA